MSHAFKEIETKYRVTDQLLFPFKTLLEKLLISKDFLYVESDDIYFTNDKNEFLRYRFCADKKQCRAELTIKRKDRTQDNIVRTEINLRTDNNDPAVIEGFCNLLGFKRNFSISKYCHIYYVKDAVLVFYSVRDHTTGKLDHFIEVEVNEDLNISEKEAMDILKYYEKLLEPIGITPQNRLKKSLFEMYFKNI